LSALRNENIAQKEEFHELSLERKRAEQNKKKSSPHARLENK